MFFFSLYSPLSITNVLTLTLTFSFTGKGHLREAVLSHEEALRVHDLCKQMRKIDLFRDILQKMHER
jgi:hypothetical protein